MHNGQVEKPLRHIEMYHFAVYGQRWGGRYTPSGPSESRCYVSTLCRSGSLLALSTPTRIPLSSDEREHSMLTNRRPNRRARNRTDRTERRSDPPQASSRRPRALLEANAEYRRPPRTPRMPQSNHRPNMLPHNSHASASSSSTTLSEDGTAMYHHNPFMGNAGQVPQSHHTSDQFTLYAQQVANVFATHSSQNNAGLMYPSHYFPDPSLPIGIPPSGIPYHYVHHQPAQQPTTGYPQSWNSHANMPAGQPIAPPAVPPATGSQELQSENLQHYPTPSSSHLYEPAALPAVGTFSNTYNNPSSGEGLDDPLFDPTLEQSILSHGNAAYNRTRGGGPAG
ncbi:hypothetical protein F5I97DRAFT_843207 [Phlebopus sp. FC_14]|nr:hypothetical protein F5I97DRAFT_843207 [Phlebopus sp. FC_14]